MAPDVASVQHRGHMTAETAPITWSRGRLVVLLAMTALPVLLTTGIMSLLAIARSGRSVTWLSPNVFSHGVYALSNWATFALVWAVAGSNGLRGHGLRWRLTWGRLGAALAGFVAGVAIYLAVTWIQRRIGVPTTGGMSFRSLSPPELAVLAFAAAVTAPFCEEVFFRVLWVGGLARRTPVGVAATLSIVAFAAIHFPYFGLGGVLFISVWTVVPLLLFLRTGDFSTSLVMHTINNVWAYLIVPAVF